MKYLTLALLSIEALACKEIPVTNAAELTAALKASAPGHTIKLAAGTYKHTDLRNIEGFVFANSGTALEPIILDGQNVATIEGWGYVDNEFPPPNFSERLISIRADYIVVRNLKVTRSNRYGIYSKGNFVTVDNVEALANYTDGIRIQGDSNIVRNSKAHHNRHGTGVVLTTGNKNVFEKNTSFMNGRRDNGELAIGIPGDRATDGTGGNNSDGIGSSKDCNDLAPKDAAGIVIDNLCKENVFQDNILYENADDGIDISMAHSKILNNKTTKNGPQGKRGIKVLRSIGYNEYRDNIADTHYRNYELRGSGNTYINNQSLNLSGSDYFQR